jgi:hypothetical protein
MVEIKSQDPVHFLHPLLVLMARMTGGNASFRLRAIQVRTPIRHNVVAAIRSISAASVANNGMVRDVIRDRQGVHSADEWVFWRQDVDACREVRLSRRVSGCYDVLRCRHSQ